MTERLVRPCLDRNDGDVRIRVGKAGALVSDSPSPLLQHLDLDSARFYGGENFLCETIDGEAAERVVLCWEYCRHLSTGELRALTGHSPISSGGPDA